jgi:nucleotide-binding universal stress UspA family protein
VFHDFCRKRLHWVPPTPRGWSNVIQSVKIQPAVKQKEIAMTVSIERILFVTDFSEPARFAQRYAVELADKFGAGLHAFHAVSDEVLVPAPDLAAQWLRDELQRAGKQLATELGPTRATLEVRPGNPVQEILRYAGEQNIDLIVIGTHGHTGLSRLLLGSVAEKIVRLATCPVLTVHPSGHQFVLGQPLKQPAVQ